jgi:hypothetical protein
MVDVWGELIQVVEYIPDIESLDFDSSAEGFYLVGGFGN